MVALAIGARPRLASIMGGLSLISITMVSIWTGERINFLIRACSGMLAALMWRPNWRRYIILIAVELLAISLVLMSSSSIQNRYVNSFIDSLPTGHIVNIIELWLLVPKRRRIRFFLVLAPQLFVIFVRKLLVCHQFSCHNHPHNFYIQLITETGFVGFLAGILMILSIIWATFVGWRKKPK